MDAGRVTAVRPARHVAACSIAGVRTRGIHHLGVAVDDLDEAVTTYERVFGARLERRETVPDQGVEAASLRLGDGRVELLASLGEETPVGKFLAKRGPGMHHVAFEVPDVRRAIDELAAKGVELVDEQPRKGLFGLEVAFLHPDAVHGVLAELVRDA
jgi:methylmalonyl-CoA/ethylmalonyl-CoA epimerase